MTKVIGLTIAGLISCKVAAIGMGYAWTFLKGGVLAVRGAVIAFRSALLLMSVTMNGIRFGGILSSLLAFGSGLWRVALGAIPAVITAIRGMSLALFTSPIGLVIGTIAAGAGLIMYYWKPISRFFKNLFAPVIVVFKNVLGWMQKVWQKAEHIFTRSKSLDDR